MELATAGRVGVDSVGCWVRSGVSGRAPRAEERERGGKQEEHEQTTDEQELCVVRVLRYMNEF